MDQSNQERQEEELQVLEAIYMSEFVDLRSDQQIEAGSPPIVCLKLTPLQSIMRHEVHAKVDLVVKYTTRYPTDPPILRLENPKGLSNEQVAKLKKDLDDQAKELTGEVMVLQLAQSVQAFLHKHNVPTFSFHEQMLKNMQKEKEIKEMEREKRLAKDKAQAKEFDDDVNKRVQAALQEREALKGERKRRHQIEERRKDSIESDNGGLLGSTPPASGRRRRNTESSESYDDMEKPLDRQRSFNCTKLKQQVEIVNFASKHGDKAVYCGRCIGHYFQGACARAGIDVESGDVVTVCEWSFNRKRDKQKSSFSIGSSLDSDNITKQIMSMEQELSYLASRLHHPNLLHYNAISIEDKNEANIIRILMDNIDGYCVSDDIDPPGLSFDIVQDYAKQLVNVLYHLHNKSVVHKDLKPGNVFISKQRTIKVCGYAVLRRLSDLYNLMQVENTETDEFADYRKLVKPGKKGDIFNLGLVVLSMLQGKIPTGYPVEIPAGLPDDAQDFLLKCLNIDEKERWTISQLVKHPFLIAANTTKNNIALAAADNSNGHDEADKQLEEENFLRTLNELNIANKTRLMTDFEILDSLGQGGFGSVIKARKKLDGLLYAIKRINLDPKSAQLKKRIIREVKLLSRLNHENVVRYYSSWIEAEECTNDETTSSESLGRSEILQRKKTGNDNQKAETENTEDSLLKYHDFDAPSMARGREGDDFSWSDDKDDEDSKGQSSDSDSSTDDEEDEEDEVEEFKVTRKHGMNLFLQKMSATTESSEGVIFGIDESFFQIGEMSDSDEESECELPMTLETSEEPSVEGTRFQKYLYIQMEYCEKSTLRNVIDEGLYKNPSRMWRLFREIVEGLSHVHSQGIIHRDLKPFNIFMDSRDQVKIGDFGLATSHTINQVTDHSLAAMSMTSDGKLSTDSSNRMTGKVGTALYVAPEIDAFGLKVKITEKVDLYSLGVIFFEMCYKPLPTGMERVKILGLLRTERIVLPVDFEDKPRPVEKKILHWLLNHNFEERPTASELLESGLVPPKLEDRHFDELLALTLKQPSSTRYKRLTAALFNQNTDPVTDQIYDKHLDKKQEGFLLSVHAHEYVEQAIRGIFTRHGATHLDIPLFMPKCRLFEQQGWITNVMDPDGIILSLPFDSRVSLARYISRNNVRNIKRYNIGNVYRDTKISRTHPKEIKECTFDIVSDAASNSLVPDAEVLYAVDEIVQQFPCLRNRNFQVLVNHTNLLKAILLQANIDDAQLNKVFSILQSSKDSKDCVQKVKQYLTDEGIPEHTVTKTVSLLDFEGPIKKARESLQSVRKSRGIVGSLAKQALIDLTNFCKSAQAFGLEMPIVIQTCLAYNLSVFSGVVFQIVAENKRKRKLGSVDILAGGGRYDSLLESFKMAGEQKALPRAAGVSIAFEKIVNAILKEIRDNEYMLSDLSCCDVLVGVIGETTLPEQRLGVVRELWAHGIRAMLSSYEAQQDCTPESLQDLCKEAGINHFVLLKSSENDFVRIRSREKERFNEFKVPRHQMCEYLLQKISGKSETKEIDSAIQRVSSTTLIQPGDSHQLMNLTFILQDKSVKRRIESQVQSVLSNVITRSFLKTPVEVVVVDLPPIAMRNLFAHLDIDADEEEFGASVSDIIDKQKLKKIALYIHRICSTLREIKKERNIVMIYGYKEDFYRIFV